MRSAAPSQSSGYAASKLHEILGVDWGSTTIKAVRLRMVKDQIHVVATDLLPTPAAEDHRPLNKLLPSALETKWAALATQDPSVVARIVNVPPGTAPEETDLQRYLREQLTVDASMRLRSTPLAVTKAGGRHLAVAFPEARIQSLLARVAAGTPAPLNLEWASLSALNSLQRLRGASAAQETFCLVDSGAHATVMFFVHKGIPILVRKHEVGAEAVVDATRQSFNVDRPTALTLLAEGSIDLSQILVETLLPMVRQLCIARDFVEREEACQMQRVFLCGGLSLNALYRSWLRETLALPVERWDPFADLALSPGPHTSAQAGREILFAAALEAARTSWTHEPSN